MDPSDADRLSARGACHSLERLWTDASKRALLAPPHGPAQIPVELDEPMRSGMARRLVLTTVSGAPRTLRLEQLSVVSKSGPTQSTSLPGLQLGDGSSALIARGYAQRWWRAGAMGQGRPRADPGRLRQLASWHLHSTASPTELALIGSFVIASGAAAILHPGELRRGPTLGVLAATVAPPVMGAGHARHGLNPRCTLVGTY